MKAISAFAFVLLAALAFQQQLARAYIACPDVLSDMEPCLSFLQGDGAAPSGQCCAGARSVYAAASTTAERRATCECLKTAYRQINAQLSAAQALPDNCGLSLPYTITPDIDCSKIE
ncbi:unnamed protein product [Urochloa decumbens]|uniref:Non-specific lipid-transfer protein n=1 Tax=Urochloa decumbens TaxID=240449 RepID=A0ABC9DNA7_9POAL